VSRQASPHTVHAATTETRPRFAVLESHGHEDLDSDGDEDDDGGGAGGDGGISKSTRGTFDSDCDDDILTFKLTLCCDQRSVTYMNRLSTLPTRFNDDLTAILD